MFEGDSFYQVEFNLIASGMGPISERHAIAMKRLATMFGDKVPEQETTSNTDFLVTAMKSAHKAYGNQEAIIVVVVGLDNNIID